MPARHVPSSGPARDLESEAKWRAIFGLSPIILCITGLEDGRIREVNETFLEVTGYTREEILGHTVTELGLWLNLEQREQGMKSLLAGTPIRGVETRFRMKNGEERVTVLAADVVMVDGQACILAALTDITDRKRAEEALRESERRFLVAFHANPLPMSITSLHDQRHLEVNEAAVRHSGFTREEMLGRTKAELGFWVSEEQRERMLNLLREHGRLRDFEVTFRNRTGELRQFLANSEVIMFGGEPAVLSVSLDITERSRIEAERQARQEEAEALAESLRAAERAKDAFLAMLGHELRNPLGTITNAVAVLDKVGGSDTSRNLVAVIGRQAGHLARLVDDLLDVARLSSGKIELRLEPLDLHELARQSLEARTRLGGHRGHSVELLGEAVYVEGDRTRLAQVLDNLVDNAIKYTPPGGRVTVATERSGEAAVLRVRDSGIGMVPELVPCVFDFFTQAPQTLERSHGGLGLGLALVKRLVELHGGSVSASSAGIGMGSEFTITLPAASEPTPRAVGPATGVRVGGKPLACRVLVVEDSADARLGLQLLLQQSGHSVETAANGQDGLAKLRRFRPDVALIDVGLPGMDGYELARMARSQPETRDIRLIAITGYGQAADKRRALDAGFDLHLAKPVDPLALQELLNGIERSG
jgi:PAS domain S-box-containing protein